MRVIWGFCYVVIYTIANMATAAFLKLIFSSESDEIEDNYDKPLFIGYVSSASFVLFLSGFAFKFGVKAKGNWNLLEDKNLHYHEMKTGLVTVPFYFIGNIGFYYSLMLTSMTALFVLINTGIIFVFILSMIILKDKFSYMKLIATIIGVIGIICITNDDRKESEDKSKVIGDFLAVLSAVLFAFYLVYLGKFVPFEIEKRISLINVFGFIGLFSMIIFWPLLVIFHYYGIETLELPGSQALIGIIVNIIFGVYIYDYFWGRASILLTPLQINTGDLLIIPISIIVDQMMMDTEFTIMFYLGTILIIVGFMTMTFSNYDRLMKNEEDEQIVLKTQSESSDGLKAM